MPPLFLLPPFCPRPCLPTLQQARQREQVIPEHRSVQSAPRGRRCLCRGTGVRWASKVGVHPGIRLKTGWVPSYPGGPPTPESTGEFPIGIGIEKKIGHFSSFLWSVFLKPKMADPRRSDWLVFWSGNGHSRWPVMGTSNGWDCLGKPCHGYIRMLQVSRQAYLLLCFAQLATWTRWTAPISPWGCRGEACEWHGPEGSLDRVLPDPTDS